MFLIMSICALIHACKSSRLHIFVWFTTFFVGTANDVIFMALPTVDNFWQAQSTIMLTPRLPLYIPCVYNAFMYWPVVAAWRRELPLLAEASLAGLLAGVFYFPYDLTGATFLWWTWHDTYAGIRYRLLSVPFGSTTWTITFVFCFAALLRLTTNREHYLRYPKMALSFGVCCLLTTACMMLQMGLFQFVGRESLPSPTVLLSCVGVYLAILKFGWLSGNLLKSRNSDDFAKFVIILYFSTLILIGLWGNPGQHVSTGLHQPLGKCRVEQFDIITQTKQYEFLCVDNFDETYDFHCVKPPTFEGKPVDWYTVCGKEHKNFPVWIATLVSVCVLAQSSFSYLFKSTNRPKIMAISSNRND